MGCFGQKVAFFPCRILKRAILYRDSPLFYEFLVLSLGGRNLLVLFSFIVHKAGLQPTGNDVGALAFHAILAAKLDEVALGEGVWQFGEQPDVLRLVHLPFSALTDLAVLLVLLVERVAEEGHLLEQGFGGHPKGKVCHLGRFVILCPQNGLWVSFWEQTTY